ncbi:MAG TPA: carbonic anhydrase [Thermoanaerobaculia bacterium]|nr:carbonic anhydrase [Thermoanaerobaculia bacterium]
MARALVVLLFAAPLFAQEITGDQLWAALLQGNKQYVAGTLRYEQLAEERAKLKNSELPPIAVLACSDSRVPPELVFNQTLGAMHVVRSAGNVADELGIASLELSLNAGTKLLVVLAHENCSAVGHSLGTGEPATPAQQALAKRIRSSFAGIGYEAANIRKAVEANARASAAQLLANSKAIRDAVAANGLKIMPAYYDLTTGAVTKID